MKKIVIIIICLLFLSGCSQKEDSDLNKEKLTAEIKYIGRQLIDVFHDLNNISLQNYELATAEIEMNEESSTQTEGSQASSAQESSSQSSKESFETQSDGENSLKSSENKSQNISVTEMSKNSILNINKDNIDWKQIKEKIDTLNNAWGIIMIDLYNTNVSKDDLNSFNNQLNSCIISIKEENRKSAFTNLTNLYSYIPKFLTVTSSDKEILNIETTKYYIILSYSAASQEEWGIVSQNLLNAENSFLSLLNSKVYSKNKAYKINKIYVLLKDLQNALSVHDKDLFYLKYKNLMECINSF